jgi:hypothetical protein
MKAMADLGRRTITKVVDRAKEAVAVRPGWTKHDTPADPSRKAVPGSPKSKFQTGWPTRRRCRTPDKEKSRERARELGGTERIPPGFRNLLTECERAVLVIISRECMKQGFCDLCVDQIAAQSILYTYATLPNFGGPAPDGSVREQIIGWKCEFGEMALGKQAGDHRR